MSMSMGWFGQARLWVWSKVSTVTMAQSTVEYALVGALVVIAAAGALTLLGTELTHVFNNVTNKLAGR
jgi:Flp pilus assembly pilin Flp